MPVAVTAIEGPGGISYQTDKARPERLLKKPMTPDKKRTFGKRFASNNAVEAGVIIIAPTAAITGKVIHQTLNHIVANKAKDKITN